MKAVPLPYTQLSPEWLAARRTPIIGSSDLPIITGSAPYTNRSAYDLWAYKTGRLDELPVDDATQELFDLGHALEPVIAERYTAMTGRRLRRVNRMLRHPEVEWATASLDRVSAVKGERLIIEIKWDPWARFSRAVEGIPPHVLEQVQWQLMVTGYPAAEVAVLLGSHVDRFEVQSDDGFQRDLLYIAERFHDDHLIGGTPPPVDGSEATRRAIARLHPDDNGEQMKPTTELRALMRELHEAEPAAKAAAEEVDRLKNAIRSALGDYSGSQGDGWSVSFKKSKPRRTTDWKVVAAEYREIAHQVGYEDRILDSVVERRTTESDGGRRLLPKWDEEGSWT